MRIWPLFLVLAFALSLSRPAGADDYERAMRQLAEDSLQEWASHSTIVDAVRAQNQKRGALSAERTMAFDRRWHDEMRSPSKPMIQALMSNVLSSFLNLKKRRSGGLITEIVVMDQNALNAGLTDIVADGWHGGEAAWQSTYPLGPDAIYIGAVRRDAKTRRMKSRIGLPVVDPVTRKPIGAVAIGIDVDKLPR
jgi:hypothetical protein